MKHTYNMYYYTCNICEDTIDETDLYDEEGDFHLCDDCAQDTVDYLRENHKELFKKISKKLKSELEQ